LTFKDSSLVKVIQNIDISHLVLETDSPYLAPVPYRGTRNEPAHVLQITQCLATIKELSLKEIASITTDNAKKVFCD